MFLENSLNGLSNFALVSNLEDFASLDLSGNDIKSLFLSEIEIFENLKHLVLAKNGIKHVHPLKNAVDSLQHLDLSENLISKISNSTFEGLVSLRKLDLSGNELENLASSFTKTPLLEFLNLAKNKLGRNMASNFSLHSTSTY